MTAGSLALNQIASCVAGHDPDDLPLDSARGVIARLVPRVQAVETLAGDAVTAPAGVVRWPKARACCATNTPSPQPSPADAGEGARTKPPLPHQRERAG